MSYQFHLRKFGLSCEQGFGLNPQAWGNDTSKVIARCRNGAKGRGGAEVNNNEIPAIFMIRGCGIYQPVTADFLWVGITECETCVRIRGDDQCLLMKVLVENVLDGSG